MYLSNLQLVMMAEISQEASTGYDLSKSLLDKGWKASHQQIYRDLAKLYKQGVVSLEEIPQSGKPDKKLYLLNETEKSLLTNALDIEPSVQRPQDEALVHLFLANRYYFEQLDSLLLQQLENAVKENEAKLQQGDVLSSLITNRECERLMAEHHWVTNVLNTMTLEVQTQAA